MAEIRVTHEFACDETTYWEKCFFDEEYNRALFLGELGFPKWAVTKNEVTDATIKRRLEIEPKTGDIPGPMKKLIGEKMGYSEEGVFDRKTRRYTYSITTYAMPDKTKINGIFYVEKVGDKRIRRVCETRCDVKVFGVGGLVEDRILGDTRANFEAAARFTAKWIADKGL